jgi:urease accessory protein
MLRATTRLPADHGRGIPFDLVVLAHDERRLRRKLLTLAHGDTVLVDFPEAVTLDHGEVLLLEDGRLVEVIAAEEPLHAVTGRDAEHLMRLAWHLGNRHLSAQIERDRILIKRDHVIRDMLVRLGAEIADVSEPFFPEYGAYHEHSHAPHALVYRR